MSEWGLTEWLLVLAGFLLIVLVGFVIWLTSGPINSPTRHVGESKGKGRYLRKDKNEANPSEKD